MVERRRHPSSRAPSEPIAIARIRFALLGLALAWALLAYLPALSYEFVFDDWEQIVENSSLRDPSYWWKAFGQDLWHFRLPDPSAPGADSQYYRPLFGLLLWTEYQLFGLDPTGYHAVGIALHLLAVWLVYRLALRLFGASSLAPGAAALLFAAHPVHVESVAWPSAAVDLLLAPAFLGAALLHIGDPRRTGGAGNPGWRLAAPALFGLALLTKETALVLPLLILIFDVVQRRSGWRPRSWLPPLLPYLLLTGAYLAVRVNVLGTIADPHDSSAGWGAMLLTLPWAVTRYAAMALLGLPLGPGHPVVFVRAAADLRFLLPALLLAALALGAALLARRDPQRCGSALALLIVPLLPPLYLRGLYSETLVQDRYLFLPSAGAALLWAGLLIPGLVQQKWAAALLAGLALGGAWRTLQQRPYWRNEIALFSRAVEQVPDSGLYHHRLGLALQRSGRTGAALAHLKRVVELPGADWVDYANLAQLQLNAQRYSAAAESYRRCLERVERHPKASKDPRRARLVLGLASVYERLGRDRQALDSYARALAIDASLAAAYDGLARSAIRGRIVERGRNAILELLEAQPWTPPAASTLGLLLLYQGDLDAAGAVLEDALQRAPQHAVSHLYFAQVLLRRGERQAAAAAARRALQLQPDLSAARALLQDIEHRSGAQPSGP
ncbi:MAG TPA: glycosyltransferase family 39 protein [Acidobacteriota bacterium]